MKKCPVVGAVDLVVSLSVVSAISKLIVPVDTKVDVVVSLSVLSAISKLIIKKYEN